MGHRLPLLRRSAKRHPRITIIACLALFSVCLVTIAVTRFSTDVTRLIPGHAPKTALYFEIMEQTGGMERAYVVFSSDRIEDHLGMIDAVGSEIAASQLIRSAEWKISRSTAEFLRGTWLTKAPLILTAAELEEFSRRLTPEGMRRELAKTRVRAGLPGVPEELILLDPLNLLELFARHGGLFRGSIDLGTGYFLMSDRKRAVMVLDPAGSPRDIAFCRDFVGSVNAIIDRHRTGGISAELTGSHAITLHEASVMKREILTNIVLSFGAVIAVFLLFFRSASGLLFVIIPVFFSMVVATGTVLWFTGTMSEVTGGFGALIAGLGIDLGIVLYVRYLIELDSGRDRTSAMDEGIVMAYRGITTGVVTSVLTFLPMLLSSFRGVREIGFLTGIGLVICWAVLISLVPVITRPRPAAFSRIAFLERVALFSRARSGVVLGVVAVMTAAFAFFVPRVEIVGDITRLGTRDNPARKLLLDLQDGFLRTENIFVRARADSLEQALRESRRIKRSLAGSSVEVFGPDDLLPPLEDQLRNLSVISGIDADAVVRTFLAEADRAGFERERFFDSASALRAMLENRNILERADLGPVRKAIDRILVRDERGWNVIVTGSLKTEGMNEAIDVADMTGPALVRKELLSVLANDTFLISIVGLLLVNIVLYLDFRKISYVILSQAPVAISIVWTLGVMGMSGISLNFMNAFVFVMLFGIGTDYTVHLLHRYEKDRDMGKSFLEVGKAVLIAGLTTVAGVGSIGISSYQGLASMGQVTAIGTLSCVALTMTLVPALMGVMGIGED